MDYALLALPLRSPVQYIQYTFTITLARRSSLLILCLRSGPSHALDSVVSQRCDATKQSSVI